MRTEQDLRRALAAETGDLTLDLSPDRVLARARRYRQRRRAALATALAAVTTVATATLVLRGPANEPATPPPSAVPWVPMPTVGAPIPGVTVPSSPNPTIAAGLPPCRVGDLRMETTMGAASGSRTLVVAFRNATAIPCRLDGYPDVVAYGTSGPLPIPVERETGSDQYRDPVAVIGDRAALLRLSWSSSWCTAPVNNAILRLTLPDGGGTLTVPGFGESQCSGTPGATSPIHVGGLQPDESGEPHVVTVFAGVTAQIRDVTVAGDRVRFTVVLTAPAGGDVPLEPCPDYTVYAGASTYISALNCRAVPYRDRAGQPHLPAGTPVAFAMEANLPDGASVKLGWALNVPDPVAAGTEVGR